MPSFTVEIDHWHLDIFIQFGRNNKGAKGENGTNNNKVDVNVPFHTSISLFYELLL